MLPDTSIAALIAKLNGALSGQFLRGVLKLASGAALSQAILLLALIAATRLYSPADFGVLAVINATATIIGVAACLRYDIAVPLPNSRSDAANLLVLSLVCAFIAGLLFAMLYLIVPEQWALFFFNPATYHLLWLAAPAIYFWGAMSAAQNWHIREKAYGTVSRSRIIQALAHAAIQIGGGYLGGGAAFLIGSQIANYGVGVAVLLGLSATKTRGAGHDISISGMKKVAIEYKRFPIFSTWEALFNAAGIFLPVIIIGALASPTEVGHLQLGLYAMQAMIGLVGTAIAQVYFSRAAEEHRAGRLATFTGKVLANLAKAGPGPILFIGIIGPSVFPLMFGPDWARSGILVTWMTPWFIMQFLSVPIALAFAVTGHQKVALFLQLFGLVLRSSAVIIAAYGFGGFTSEAYAVSGFVFYLAYLAVILRTTGFFFGSSDLRQIFLILCFWVALGLFVLAGLWAVFVL